MINVLTNAHSLGGKKENFMKKTKETVEHCEKVLESMGHKNVDLNPFYNKKNDITAPF